MQKTALIILLVMASLCSGLALTPEGFSPGRILQAFASMYAPSDPDNNDRVMTFGRELLPQTEAVLIPQQPYLK
ncbi:MAG: hypothetical protein PHD82_05065 [Candidatus Riflebacteria bacterium]|jgi:hypothetical protein|nr:hypothetical protein [Candidatus Riflebacteria bacterium]